MPDIPANAIQALLAAGFWGMGDFSGGMSAKSAPARLTPVGVGIRVVLFSHLTSISVLVLLALARHEVMPHGAALACGLCAGLVSSCSLAAFYVALSRGAMGASAAISGLLAAAIPAGLTLATEGSPGSHRLAGFLIAGIAIWLIAAGPGVKEARSTILLASASGVGFGIYFVALKFVGAHAGPVWTLATSRSGSITTCALILLLLNLKNPNAEKEPISRRMKLWIVSTAIFDTSGNLMFVLSTQSGRLDIASVLASLYPAGTILLAAGVLREKLTTRQIAGMGIAVAAVALITL